MKKMTGNLRKSLEEHKISGIGKKLFDKYQFEVRLFLNQMRLDQLYVCISIEEKIYLNNCISSGCFITFSEFHENQWMS